MGAANILRVVLRQARAIGSFSRAGSFGMRVQFGRWTHVSPSLVTSASSAGVIFAAISSTLRSWSCNTAAITVLTTSA